MKKMKMILLAVVIITAVTGAFAAKKKFDCYNQQQYYRQAEGVYVATGQYGVNYYCNGAITTSCTFILTPNGWEACRTGTYSPITP
ncbi:MAG: DUF6520 family protein [Pseudobacter sp.]|uniref:DUF6520 family protein n=1 Tax=Pseudobacter sp. TaxID=2045420 RepID=UPI003F806B86